MVRHPGIRMDNLLFRRCQYRLRPAGWRYPLAYHRRLWEMYICWQGRLVVGLPGGEVELQPRQLVIIPPRVHHQASVRGEEDGLVGLVLLELVRPWPPLRQIAQRCVTPTARAHALLRQLTEVPGSDDFAEARRKALLWVLLLELVSPLDDAAQRLPPDLGIASEDPLVAGVLEHLHHHLAEGLAMAQLCRTAGYSDSRLRHLFRDRTGISLSEAMLRMRLDESLRLLRFSGLKIAAVARMVGFRQPARFARFFRQRMGCSPGQFLASHVPYGAKWGLAEDPDEVRLE